MNPDSFEELMKVQRSMASRLHVENELDKKVDLLSLIQSLVPDRRGRILMESIVVEARQEGFSEEEVDRLLDALQSDGYLKRIEDGIMMLL